MAGNDVDHRLVDRLASAEAHVWLVRLDTVGQNWPDWEQVLAPDEIAKANRLLQPADRLRSGATRALLRRLLGGYLDIPSTEVRFAYNRFGKPGLAQPPHPNRLRFSVAHSGDFALLGFTSGRLMGVDLETVRANWDYRELATAICNEREIREIELLPEAKRAAELFRYWTLKEAYLKALGVGLSFPYRRIEIARRKPCSGGSECEFAVSIRGCWSVFPIYDIPGYAAAVVVAGKTIKLCRCSMDWVSG